MFDPDSVVPNHLQVLLTSGSPGARFSITRSNHTNCVQWIPNRISQISFVASSLFNRHIC